MSIARISVGPGGVQANGPSYSGAAPTFSGDGRYVVFESNASNLVSGDTNGTTDVLVLDRETGNLSRVSTTSSGGQLAGQSFDGTISVDGRYVAFVTSDSAFTGGSGWAVVRKDLQTGVVQTAGSAYVQGIPENPHEPQLSADGRYVVYNGPGRSILRYDYQTGATDTVVDGDISGSPAISSDGRFVTFFSGVYGSYLTYVKDMVTGSLMSPVNTGFNFEQQITPDGRYIVYQTTHEVVSGDTNGVADIIRYDRQTGESLRVNTDSTGAQAVGDHSFAPMISNDGRYIVFFSLATNLASGDTNGRHDVFVKDMVTGRLELVSKSAAGIPANGTSLSASISADGRFVTFSSDAPDLVDGDTNGVKDVFMVDLAESGFWQGIEKVGSNVRINSTTAGNQTGSGIVALDDGRFLVAMFDAPNGKLKGQWFDAAGDKSGSEFEIGPGSGGGYVSSLKLANGSFLVFTEREFVLFDSVGVAIESAVPQLTGHSGYIHLAPTQTGFVIAASVNGYTHIGIQAYDFAGQKVGPQFTVASGTFNEFVTKDVVGFGNGGFGLLFDQVSTGLLLQRFDGAGNAVGTPARISSSTSDINSHSQIDSVALADGRAFVAWSQDGMIRGRFLAADGTPQGAEFAVSPATPSG